VKTLLLALLLIVGPASAQAKRTFTGTITDSMCPAGDHSKMRMGANDAECSIACVDAHGATFVLYDGKQVFALSDQKTSEKFAGKRVTVAGTVDAAGKTVQVDSITAAK
jgi:hypothetical protein